ncbi:type II toxin-antitoxin system RelE/ParE family toxin [Patescibacteria group bacterium]|nr:type II toxin-antitoxin system RelE/ParE family toxin [Patescibacteria group bacterium]MCG2702048.1 type II toxin-antitoxin system RelE/ParE family toxin [Candidatus Parcubacteria bacterium]MBU4265567.1 type II toxin-antitoxin system RelE/ParE family toxin [Patescibacteria group bacterium]MBU4389896.1 type II toxin-antitoxin system RelE/ParE family toxin [Patescibacteria group bacterium]MBU4397113.1 type II toxin-antitoxin system RelE/ParE family toxin [Patescibacteria group bacterium]
MKLEFSPTAQKQLKKLPKHQIKKIIKKINLLEKDPNYGKKLQGELKNKFSLRAWPYRIVYKINNQILYIVVIQHRQSAYK